MDQPPTLGLCMIVRNEAHILRRCLTAARPLLDYLLVVDTGSTDGTPDLVRDFLADHGLPGQVLNDPWRDFGSNRSFAVERLRAVPGLDYALMLDADDLLVLAPGFDAAGWKRGLTADLYDVELRCGPVRYSRPQIWRNRLPARYRGVLHEFLEVPGLESRASAPGLYIEAVQDSARNRNPRKSADDARLLAAAAEAEADPWLRARYRFYQARCHEVAGEWAEALEAFRQRAEMGFWSEEVYLARLGMGFMLERLERPPEEALAAFLRAHEAAPRRGEALHAALRRCRLGGLHQTGWILAQQAIKLRQPPDALFVQPAIYEWGLRDEYALAAFYSGNFAESLAICEVLLADPLLPAAQRPRVAANAGFARDRLAQAASAAAPAPKPTQQRFVAPSRPAPGPGPRPPGIFMAILAKQAGQVLPLYLECLERLDYPTDRITLHVRTNDNLDGTAAQLEAWLDRNGHRYAGVHYDASPVGGAAATTDPHDWTPARLSVIRRLRQQSLDAALASDCDFYFTADVDNFLRPETLARLVALDVPLVAPLLHHVRADRRYANFHAAIDARGYFAEHPAYDALRTRQLPGLHAVPVVHCTYLLRRDAIALLTYEDGLGRYDYVTFSDSARRAGVPQLLDNRAVYGILTMNEPLAESRHRLAALLAEPLDPPAPCPTPRSTAA